MSQIFCILSKFSKNVSVSNTHHWRIYICEVYQRMTGEKKRHYLFFCAFFELFVAREVNYMNKKEKCMLGSTCFLTWSLTIFMHVTNMSVSCQKTSVLSVFEPTWHKTTIPTKLVWVLQLQFKGGIATTMILFKSPIVRLIKLFKILWLPLLMQILPYLLVLLVKH